MEFDTQPLTRITFPRDSQLNKREGLHMKPVNYQQTND